MSKWYKVIPVDLNGNVIAGGGVITSPLPAGSNVIGKVVPSDVNGIPNSSVAFRLDEATATITYIGTALPGTATSSALWKIKRLTFSANCSFITEWANGSIAATNIWDNRASLSYS